MPITFKTEAGENLVIPTQAGQSAPSLADTARVAYDVERAKVAHPMGGMAQARPATTFGLSPNESLARFGSEAYGGAPRANVNAMQDLYSRHMQQSPSMVAGAVDALLPLPVASIAQRYMPQKMMEQMTQGGRPYYSNGLLDGVFLDGRYTGFGQDPRFQQQQTEREVVLPEYDATANAKRCPDGYIFDEQLQACRLAVSLPNQPEPMQTVNNDLYEMPYEDIGLLGDYGANLFYG